MSWFDIFKREKRGVTEDITQAIGLSLNRTSVTDETALALSAVWRCVQILSNAIAGMPRSIRIETATGSEVVTNHQANNVLRRMANPYMSALDWNQLVMAQALLKGNSYSIIERNQAAQPVAFWPVDKVKPTILDNQLWYNVEMDDGEKLWKAEDIFHIKDLLTNGVVGRGVIQTHAENLGLSLSAQKYGKEFYDSDATPKGYIKQVGTLTPEQSKNLRNSWTNTYGLGKNRMAVLDMEQEFVSIAIPPETAQYLGTRKFQKNEIATIFGVPAHMVNEMERSTFNNIEHTGIEFVKFSLLPWMRKFESEVNNKLLTEAEKENHFAKWNANGLMRGDSKARSEFYAKMFAISALNPNQIRALEDMNPYEGGDKYFVPMNMEDINNRENEE